MASLCRMWPFKHRPLLDDEIARWHVDNFCWLLRNLTHTPIFRDSRLVLPAPGFFKIDDTTGHAMAEGVFREIKTYAGMTDWPVNLVTDVEVYEPKSSELIQATTRHTPLGLFMRDHDGGVHISYAPKLLKKPINLIATLAHELAHYLVHSIEDTLPCDPTEEEPLTDETACFMGFGVFLANSAFEFEQYRDNGAGTQGWRTQRSGYLPEADLVFDTALFITAKGIDPAPAFKYLKPHLADHLKKALKDVEAYKDELRAAIDNALPYS